MLMAACAGVRARYEPDWESLDARPLPAWYDEAKIGVFAHWGVYSVPSFGSEWFWWNWQALRLSDYVEFMKKIRPPGFTYQDFAAEFKAELFDTGHFTDILQASGAKYKLSFNFLKCTLFVVQFIMIIKLEVN